jgi:hypothetical protein
MVAAASATKQVGMTLTATIPLIVVVTIGMEFRKTA